MQRTTQGTGTVHLDYSVITKRAHSSSALVLVIQVTLAWALIASGHCMFTRATTLKCN